MAVVLQSQLGASPVTTLGVPFNGIVRAHANPLRQGSVLSLRFGQRSLGAKGLLGRLQGELKKNQQRQL